MKKLTWGPLTQLRFMPGFFPIECYILEEENGITLIDAGMPFIAKGIHAAIEATGKPLLRILLTHAHEDHIGAVPYLKKQYPAASVGISARDARLLAGDRSLLPGEAESPVRGGVPKRAPFTPDFLIGDGDVFGTLRAVAAPGHTPGHMAFFDSASRSLIAGDAFQTRGGLAVSGQLKLTFPFPAMATWHAPTALASARKLLALAPDRLAVGHGPALEKPDAAIAKAIADAERRTTGRSAG